MQMTLRWYGVDDPVTLSHIRQIPSVKGVVTALYSSPVGEAWKEGDIVAQKKIINDKYGIDTGTFKDRMA